MKELLPAIAFPEWYAWGGVALVVAFLWLVIHVYRQEGRAELEKHARLPLESDEGEG